MAGQHFPKIFLNELFHDLGPNFTETSQLICSANQWTGFYMTGTCVMKELMTATNGWILPIHSCYWLLEKTQALLSKAQ